jgi:hypothetical protein
VFFAHALHVQNMSSFDTLIKIDADCTNIHQKTPYKIPKLSKYYINTPLISPKLCVIAQFTIDNEEQVEMIQINNTTNATLYITVNNDRLLFNKAFC